MNFNVVITEKFADVSRALKEINEINCVDNWLNLFSVKFFHNKRMKIN